MKVNFTLRLGHLGYNLLLLGHLFLTFQKKHSISIFRVKQSKCLTLKMKVPCYFRLLGSMHLLTQCNILEDLNL